MNNGFAKGFFEGLSGLLKAGAVVVFAIVLAIVTGNIFTGIILAGIALYVWMLEGEIDSLEKRIKNLENLLLQKSVSK